MASSKASEMRKDVIDVKTGRKLGELIDVEIDHETGKITAIVVPGESKMFGLLGGGPDIVIPWTKIKKIGPDVILVEIDKGGDSSDSKSTSSSTGGSGSSGSGSFGSTGNSGSFGSTGNSGGGSQSH
jgi:YlmC/YmxH family sporulation protein